MGQEPVIGRRFAVLSHAAKGGMGSIYRAKDLITNQIVAVKVLTLDRPMDVVRFGREAMLLATIRHPNVVNYVAHGEASGIHYLAQEWVEGVTLANVIRTPGISAREAVGIASEIASALEAIHALGVIHRDVKPANVILGDGTKKVKLVDFGIARLANKSGALTRTGIVVGTPSYMSPEQARGRSQIDATTDVWALGCLLYEALTSHVAFAGMSPASIRAKVLLAQPTPLSRYCPEAPHALGMLIEDMLQKDPNLRPKTGGEVLARLRALPEIPDGPRRRGGTPEPATAVMPVGPGAKPRDPTGAGAANCFVFMAPTDPGSQRNDEEPVTQRDAQVAKIAAQHAMDVQLFEDGSALLSGKATGKVGAVNAARAGLALRAEVFDGAVSVFGQAVNDSFEQAVDRGSALLDRAVMGTVFADPSEDPDVLIDDVIAELIAEELPVVKTDDGAMLKSRRSG